MEIIIIIVLCTGIMMLGCYMLLLAFSNHVTHDQLLFTNYPKNFGPLTIFFISDIHRRRIHPSVIEQVKNKADIVVIGGDLTEKRVPFNRVKENLLLLTELGPAFFIWGNNDYEVNEQHLTSVLEETGIKILKNDTEVLQRNGEMLLLVGVDEVTQNPKNIERIVKNKSDIPFKILLCHNPEYVKTLKREDDISLILSGHTHGGQIRIFGYGPFEHGGIKNVNGMTLFVSNGYGTSLVPLRLGAKPETHLITIGHLMSETLK